MKMKERAKKYAEITKELDGMGYTLAHNKIFDLKGSPWFTPYNNKPVGELTENFEIIIYKEDENNGTP